MNLFLVCLLVVFGVALMVLEMFFIPGIGVAGVFSVISMAAGVALAYLKISPLAGNITLVAVLLLLIIAIWLFLRGKTLDKISLKTEVSDKVDLVSKLHIQPGDRAITASRLAPMGKVRIGDSEVEAQSMGEFIDQAKPVEIVRVEGNVVLVRPAE